MGELAGRLRERVRVERWVGGPDLSGGEVGSWVAGESVWAEVVSGGFGAATEAERVAKHPRYRLRMRREARADLRCRLRWRGRVLAVLSVARDPWAPVVELLVEEREA